MKATKTDSDVSGKNSLTPVSEMFASATAAETQKVAEMSSKKGTLSYAQEMIGLEIDKLQHIQSENNEEIKKRLKDIQGLRENNLVVAGAIGGLKNVKEKI